MTLCCYYVYYYYENVIIHVEIHNCTSVTIKMNRKICIAILICIAICIAILICITNLIKSTITQIVCKNPFSGTVELTLSGSGNGME